jgi:hypothetical protein
LEEAHSRRSFDQASGMKEYDIIDDASGLRQLDHGWS